MGKLLELLGLKRKCHASKACATKSYYILLVKDEVGKEKRRQVISMNPVALQVLLDNKPACYEVYTTGNGCKIG